MAVIDIDSHVDHHKNEIRQAVAQNLSAAPGSPIDGQFYYDSTLHSFGIYGNSVWTYVAAPTVNPVTRAANAGANNTLMVSAGADRTAKDYAGGAGLIKSDGSGVVSAAVAETDYTTPTISGSLTNKTINASSNTISNLTVTMFAANVIDTDTTLAANSDSRVATQKAIKAYIASVITSSTKFLGTIDASTNPNFPAASLGDEYKISVAGLIGGASGRSVKVGDIVLCTANTIAGTDAAVGASWDILESTSDAASTSVSGNVQLATQAEAEAKSNATKAVTPVSLVNYTIKKTSTLTGDGSTITFTYTHNLGSQNVHVQIFDSSWNLVLVAVQNNTSNQTTIVFGTAPANTVVYNIVVVG